MPPAMRRSSWGARSPGCGIWRSELNQGFLATCNGAAELARGELLLLLNNDVLVGDHALDRLWQSLERHPEAGVVGAAVWGADGLPLGWRDLERWLLEQLLEGGPQVLLVGALAGAAGELAQRLQHLRPEWALVEKPTEVLVKVEAMRLPVLPGWDRQELRILASSTGLHGDGWLETPSRLVIQLLGEWARAGGLRLGFYLPEQGLQAGDPAVLIQLDSSGEAISQVLKPGLNTIVVPCSALPAQSVRVLNLSGEPLVQPANASDQRRLMAVLAELELLQQDSQGFT